MLTITCGYGFKPFSPFYETFKDMFGQLVTLGFSSSMELQLPLPPNKRTEDLEIGPQILTMDHLGLGFIACLIFMGLATVVFFMEVTVNYLNKLLSRNVDEKFLN